MPVLDRFGRPLRSLRVSVTDRCNLRCTYCMPEPEYVWLPKETLLSFEEIGGIVDAFVAVGVDRVGLTGGEALLRKGLPSLVHSLAEKQAIRDLAVTTNGVLLASQARTLREAGLHRLTVSLDTLDPRRFEQLTRFDQHGSVLAGIDAAASAGFDVLKIDTVIIRDINDDEMIAMLEFGRRVSAEVRFIEYMDVGGATRWNPRAVVSRREILERLQTHYGEVMPIDEQSSAPADRFLLPDGTIFGIISSTTEPFCASCDRSRLTADGMWLMCLYASGGTDLRRPLRAGATPDDLQRLIEAVWSVRADRGAEERLALDRETTLIPVRTLKKDAHLEMHTRGG